VKDVDINEDDTSVNLFALRTAALAPSAQVAITIATDMEPLEDEWRALEAENFNSLHQAYDFCKAWRASFDRPLRIVTGRLDGKLAFLLPLEIVRGKLFTKAQFMGAEHSNINTGLMSAEFLRIATPQAMARIADDIRDAITDVDCVALTNMPALWRDLASPFSYLPHIQNQNHAFQLRIKGDFVQTLAQLNAKRRRKKYSVSHRRLDSMGGYQHIVAETAAEKHHLLDMFFEQKAARLAEVGLPNVFACPKTRNFLHKTLDVAETETEFPLRMHALKMTGGDMAGEISAVAGLSRKGDHVIVQFCSIGSGPTIEASPGELLFHLMIEQYNQQNIGLFDFGIGDMAFKRSWCTDETVQINITLPVTSLGRLAALKEETSTRLKTPALYQFLQRLRSKTHSTPESDERGED